MLSQRDVIHRPQTEATAENLMVDSSHPKFMDIEMWTVNGWLDKTMISVLMLLKLRKKTNNSNIQRIECDFLKVRMDSYLCM